MPIHFPRQLPTPSGSRTASADPLGTSLSIDSVTGIASGLNDPMLTVFSTGAPITTATALSISSFTPVSSSSSNSGNSGTLSIGLIIGIIVGLFVALAVLLIVFMTVRHRRRINRARARALSSARKPSSRPHDDSRPAEMQMRATNLAKTASIADTSASVGQESFLSFTSTGPLALDQFAATPSISAQQPSQSGHIHGLATQPLTRSPESHTPNPFASGATHPSHSSPSHSPTVMESFAQRTPQYAHTNTATASPARDRQHPLPLPMDEPSPFQSAEPKKSVVPLAPSRIPKHSTKPAEDTRSRELKAMEDLISALDGRAPNRKNPPPALNLKIDSSAKNKKSRLSMGEGLVTPGGYPIPDDDDVLKYYNGGNRYPRPDDQENFPLPPAEVFRAALGPGGGQGKVDKGKGREKIANPFQD